jgi:hypothetical protein
MVWLCHHAGAEEVMSVEMVFFCGYSFEKMLLLPLLIFF